MSEKIIEKTRTNTIGSIRTDFIPSSFDVLIEQKGYDVIWERAVPCPCSERQVHKSSCLNCAGSGWVFINPTQIKAVITSINKSTKFKEWSVEMLGTFSITVKSDFKLNFMDKITVINSSTPHSEVLKVFSMEDKVISKTIYPMEDILEIFLFESPTSKLTLLKKGVDYTFHDNEIVYSNVDSERYVSISYLHKLQYNILDLNHDVRNTISLDSSSREIPNELPISAVARRIHNVLNDYSMPGVELFNNSYNF